MVALFALGGCPKFADDECAANACVPAADAGADGQATDPCADNPTDPKCLDDSSSVFVSLSTGDPSGDGTRAHPVKTIAGGLAKLTSTKRRIFICEGTYQEQVLLDSRHTGISLLGSLNCKWEAGGAKPVISGSTNPLVIKDAQQTITIADIAVQALDAVVEGNSIAAFVSSSNVSFKNVSLTAGNGAKGADGVLVPYVTPDAGALNGNNGNGGSGGPARTINCPDGMTTTGGKGGDASFNGEKGTPGTKDNAGVTPNCTTDVTGGDAPSTMAALGATVIGSAGPSGWAPAAGADGATGQPGQGGGGGFGFAGGGGGGGAAGGCGGKGGAGGRGGGGSIALLINAATVSVSSSELTTRAGGNGGKGSVGQVGQNGGFHGNGSGGACQGGNGGRGADGASGGGGAGGVTVGVFYNGSPPTIDPATLPKIVNLGEAGLAGVGGSGGPNGIPGAKATVYPPLP